MDSSSDLAPDFALSNQFGEEISLESLRGKWVVLFFYPKDNTRNCSIEAAGFSKLYPEFEDAQATVLGINDDSVKSHKSFCEKKDLVFSLLSDEDGNVSRSYDASMGNKDILFKSPLRIAAVAVNKFKIPRTRRVTLLIDPDGVIRYRWDKVSVKKHPNEVLEKIKELQAL